MCLLFSTLVFEQRCASDLKTTGVYSICCHEAWITVGVPDNHKVTGEFSLIARKTLSLCDPDGCSKVGSRLLLLKYCVLWTWRSKRRKCSGVKLLGGGRGALLLSAFSPVKASKPWSNKSMDIFWPRLAFYSCWASVPCQKSPTPLSHTSSCTLMFRSCWFSVINQWNYLGTWEWVFGPMAVIATMLLAAATLCDWPVIFQLHSRSGRLVEVVMARNGG